jgi:hypothetical protein
MEAPMDVAKVAAQQMDDIKNLYRTYKNMNMDGTASGIELIDDGEKSDRRHSSVQKQHPTQLAPIAGGVGNHFKTISAATLPLPKNLAPGSPNSTQVFSAKYPMI